MADRFHDILSLARREAWEPLAGVDLRSLALFRVFLAISVLANVYYYWPYADIFFAPGVGFYQREDAMFRHSPLNWSLLYISSAMPFMHFFFACYTLVGLALVLGYRTRLATVLAWVLTVSLRNRAEVFGNYGDVLHCVLLFWGMFLPLGACCSVDAALNKQRPSSMRYVSIASLALLLNMMYLYFFGALSKTGYDWQNFTAVYYALNVLEHTSPYSTLLLQFSDLLTPLTYYVYYLELFSPLLLFLPRYTEQARLIGIPLLASLHVGFMVFLSVSTFSIISLSGLLAFTPALFWNWLLPRINRWPHRRGIVMFFDRDCEFCRKLCLIFKELGMHPDTAIRPAQDDATAGPILERDNTWVVRTHDGRHLTHWQAVSYVWRRSPLLFPLGILFALPVFREMGQGLYWLIARYRSRLAHVTAKCTPYRDEPIYRPRRATTVLLCCCMALVLVYNIRTVTNWPRYIPSPLFDFLVAADLKQQWKMFSPYVKTSSNWIVIEGTTVEGQRVDLLNNSLDPPSMNRPASAWDLYPDNHWVRYFNNVPWKRTGWRVANYYCRAFETQYPDSMVESVRVLRMQQITAAPGDAPKPITHTVLVQKKCPGYEPRKSWQKK